MRFQEISNPTVSTTDWQEYSFTGILSDDATPDQGFSIFAFSGNQSGSESSSIAIDDVNIQKLYNRKSPKSTIQHREYLFNRIQGIPLLAASSTIDPVLGPNLSPSLSSRIS